MSVCSEVTGYGSLTATALTFEVPIPFRPQALGPLTQGVHTGLIDYAYAAPPQISQYSLIRDDFESTAENPNAHYAASTLDACFILFSSPDVFVAHDLAIAVACRGANHRQLYAPPAASLDHDLTGIWPLKTGDRPIARRGRVAITRQRPFVVPRFPDVPEDRQIFDWRPAQPFARITNIGLPFRRLSRARPRIAPRSSPNKAACFARDRPH